MATSKHPGMWTSEFNEIKKFLTECIESIIDVELKKGDSAENDYIVVLQDEGDNQTEKLVINKGDYIVIRFGELYACAPQDFENFYISADEV